MAEKDDFIVALMKGRKVTDTHISSQNTAFHVHMQRLVQTRRAVVMFITSNSNRMALSLKIKIVKTDTMVQRIHDVTDGDSNTSPTLVTTPTARYWLRLLGQPGVNSIIIALSP